MAIVVSYCCVCDAAACSMQLSAHKEQAIDWLKDAVMWVLLCRCMHSREACVLFFLFFFFIFASSLYFIFLRIHFLSRFVRLFFTFKSLFIYTCLKFMFFLYICACLLLFWLYVCLLAVVQCTFISFSSNLFSPYFLFLY